MTTAINNIAVSSSRLIRAGMDDPPAGVAATLPTAAKWCGEHHAGIIQELSRHEARKDSDQRAVDVGCGERQLIRPLKKLGQEVNGPKGFPTSPAKGSADSFVLRNHGIKHMVTHDYPEQAFSVRYAIENGTNARCAEQMHRVFEEAARGDGDRYTPVSAGARGKPCGQTREAGPVVVWRRRPGSPKVV
jgi:hypothetical protein